MATLPTSLALTSISDGALAVAADHRNNFAAVQTEANALLTILSGGVAGQVLTSGGGTTVAWGPAYTAYTPAWTSSGVAPALGNGGAVGHYLQVGKLVHCMGTVSFGTTSTFGTGNYFFSLPVAPSGSQAGTRYGIVTGFDSSAAALFSGIAAFQAGSTFGTIYAAAAPSGALTQLGAALPWTWAQLDEFQFNLIYEAA